MYELMVALAAAAALLGAGGSRPPGAQGTSPQSDVAVTVDGGSAFAVDLYRELCSEQGNLFFSPYSISTALAMTYGGARNNTAVEMAKVLHFAVPRDRLDAAFQKLIGDVNDTNRVEGCELRVANALWGHKDYSFLAEFLAACRERYGARLTEVDFSASEQARKTINDWVSEQTKGKIENLIGPGILNALTRLVLTNAIYFKGDWAEPFEESATQEAPFWIAADSSVPVPMMAQTHDFLYGETGDCQVIELPYAKKALSMVIVLPKQRDGLGKVEKGLSSKTLATWKGALRLRKVSVSMPRFKLTCQFQLADVLKRMGMVDAFSVQNADLSGMTGSRDLYLSHVIHKAFVDVTEEGTEAAAATAVVVALRAVAPQPPVEFKADHPFLFMIRHNGTGSLLFMGRYTKPGRE